jgi:hypothetical protein
VGDVGHAIFFVLTLAAMAIIGLWTLTYAMHCLLVVVRDTAVGQDEVTWPSEPFQDWAGGALHLVVVVVVWLAPFGVAARSLRDAWLPEHAALRFLLLAVPGLWLFFPVALFSSLSSSSRWFVFRPIVVWNLMRVAPSTLAVYAISALIAAGVAALGYVAVVSGWVVLIPVVAAVAAGALLIYARLLGRLAGKMGRLSSGKRKAVNKSLPKGVRMKANDPWAVPDKPQEPEEPAQLPAMEETAYGRKRRRVKGYGLAPEEKAQEAKAAPPDEYAPLDVETVRPVPERSAAPPPSDLDRHLYERPKRSAALPLLSGVFTFPGYSQSRKAWLLLSLCFLAFCGGACALVSLYMALYKEG